MTRPLKQRSSLGDLTKVGQGGQGVVYHAPSVRTRFSASLVYKEYKPDQRDHIDFQALAKMPVLVENSLSRSDGERLVSIAAWPCEMVEDHGTPTGFVMPEIPDQFFVSLTTMRGVSRNRAEFQHLLNNESVLNARGIVIDDVQRYRLLREVASGLAFLHSHGVCVGDISPNNLLFSLTPRDSIYFIDCDSMCINGVSALTQVETPGWEAPSGEDKATIYSDTYKLGLLALRLLVGDQGTRDVNDLPSSTPNMVRRIIAEALRTEPQKRPLPEVWTYQLGYAIEEAQDRKASQPAPSPPTPATPKSQPSPPAKAVSSPPRSPAPVKVSSPQALEPSDKVFVTVAVVGAVLIVLIVLIGIANSNSRSVSSSSPSTSPSTSGGGETATSETDTPSVGATTDAPAVNPPSTEPQQSTDHVLPDADIHGFVGYPGGRCAGADNALAIGRTAQSLAVICQDSSGAMYYMGYGLEKGLPIRVDRVLRYLSTGYTVNNVDAQYTVRPQMFEVDGARSVSRQEWIEYWPLY